MCPSPANRPLVGSSPTQPAPGKKDFGPGVQIAEVVFRTRRTVERFLVRSQLNQVARDKPGGHADLPKRFDHQPGRITARSAAQLSVSSGVCTPGSKRTRYSIRSLSIWLTLDQESRRSDRLFGGNAQIHCSNSGVGWTTVQVGCQAKLQIVGVIERPAIEVVFDEEVERIDHRHVGDQIDRDLKVIRRLRERQTGRSDCRMDPVANSEMIARLDRQTVGIDRRAGVVGRTQPNQLRPKLNRSVVAILGFVVQGDANGHRVGFLR